METGFRLGEFWITATDYQEPAQAVVQVLETDQVLATGEGSTLEEAIGRAVLAAGKVQAEQDRKRKHGPEVTH